MSTHTHRRMEAASLAAWGTFDAAGRESVVLGSFSKRGAMTDRECAGDLGFTDLNMVRPRITALLDKGLLVFAGYAKCPVTRKTVRRCKAAWDKPGAAA